MYAQQANYRFGALGAALLAVAFAASTVWSQDATQNVNQPGAQTDVGTLPPPIPPQGNQVNTMETQSANVTTDQSMPQTVQQPVGQTPQPPQPPSDRRGGDMPAELGVFMVPSDGPGVRVTRINPGSAAEVSGLRVGDFILNINGQSVNSPQVVIDQISSMRPGDQVDLVVWRQGGEHSITAMLKEKAPVETMTAGYFEPGGVVYQSDYGYGPVRRRMYYRAPGVYYGAPYGYYGYGYGNPWGYGYRWGSPWNYRYYGTPNFGYYDTPWGEGVRIGGFQFGWR
jgi:hypothetical protein